MRQLTGLNHRMHQGLGFFGNAKAQMRIAGSKARHTQHAQRIFAKGGRDMAQQAQAKIVLPAVGVDDRAIGILGEGVDRQVAAQQIGFEGHVRGGIAGKTGIARAGFAFGACQGILLPALRMEEHGKVAAYLLVARVKHLLRGGAHHHPVSVFDRQP